MHSHTLPEKSSLLQAGQVAGSVVDHATLALAVSPAVAVLCDLVEFRADALAGQTGAVAAAMQACPVPALLTVRAPEEGGIGQLSNEARDKIFTTLLPHAGLIDIEIAHLVEFAHLVAAARTRGIPVIASFHDFHGTPDRPSLEALIEKATAAGADAIKFATTLRNSQDLATLTSLQESATRPLATMGMGPLGRVSRLLLGSMGSILNYGFLDRPTIAGQWPARRLRELITELRQG